MILCKKTGNEVAGLRSALDWLESCLSWAAVNDTVPDMTPVAEGVFVKCVEYQTNSPTKCIFENHRRYIDVQFIREGAETIDVTTASDLGADGDYDGENDVQFFENPEHVDHHIELASGDFVVFFPEDAHRCGSPAKGNEGISKFVFKVDREHFGL